MLCLPPSLSNDLLYDIYDDTMDMICMIHYICMILLYQIPVKHNDSMNTCHVRFNLNWLVH